MLLAGAVVVLSVGNKGKMWTHI